MRLALSTLRVTLEYDAFRQCHCVDGTRLTDAELDQLWVRIDDQLHWRPSKDLLRTIVGTEARLRSRHPVREYLNGLQWDGKPRLDTWLLAYGGAEDTA